jgi:hypothetical protein
MEASIDGNLKKFRSTQYEVMYQSIMRTALRDGDSKETVHVFVTTKKKANG